LRANESAAGATKENKAKSSIAQAKLILDLRNPRDPGHGDNAHQEEDEPEGIASGSAAAGNHQEILGTIKKLCDLFLDSKILSTYSISMKIIATASATSTGQPSAFFARWIDHSTWVEWSPDCEWVRVEATPAEGVKGVLKPKGGPKVNFEISVLTPDREYTDVSKFPGAQLTFQHVVKPTESGSELFVQVSLKGVLAPLWAKILGKNFATSVPQDLARLIASVEV